MTTLRKFIVSLTLILILIAGFLPTLVLADLGDIPGTDFNIFRLVFGSELSSDFLTTNNVLQWLVFPFVTVIVVMYGLLSEIRVFRRHNWVNGILAITIALMASMSGWLLIFTRWLIGVGGGFIGMFAFAAVLLVGIFLWGATKFWGWGIGRSNWKGIMRRSSQVFAYEEEMARYRDLISDLRSVGTVEAIEKARQLEEQYWNLRRKKTEASKEATKEDTSPRLGYPE